MTQTPVTTLSGAQLHRLLENGYRNLKRNLAAVDALNVFPVPDGDTGKNMTMTLEGGVRSTQPPEQALGELMEHFAHGTLLSARGNSGVILSQFVSGLAEGLAHKTTCTPSELHRALLRGVEKSYEAVIHPVEGTMLTVMRESVEAVIPNPGESFDLYFDRLLRAMQLSLAHTPELLDVLKQAGVVDSGGAGMVYIFEGMLMGLQDNWLEADASAETEGFSPVAITTLDPNNLLQFGYCTEFILQLQPTKTDVVHFDLRSVISRLEELGESIVAVADKGLLKVHIHSFAPEEVLAFARTMGEFLTIKIENMAVQHHETITAPEPKPRQRFAVVATAQGLGIAQSFLEIGAAQVIDGGQTNNPSTSEFLKAFRQVNADHIIVLPNNSNLILTARQAAELYTDADVRVLETRSIAEGYSALSMLEPGADSVEEVIESMTRYLPYVTTCYVTNATRDAVLNGLEIRKDDFIGLTDDTVLAAGTDRRQVVLELLARLPDIDEKQVVTFFYGKDVAPQELDELEAEITRRWPLIEVGRLEGSQELYSYIMSVE